MKTRFNARELIAHVVKASSDHPWAAVLISAVLAVVAGVYVAGNFRMTSDTTELISASVPWRQREIEMTKAFPQNADTIVLVVDGATPELAQAATQKLSERLAPRHDVFRTVRRPDGGPFLEREGLLFQSTEKVQDTVNQIVSAQPFLGPLAADPSLRGVANAISTMATGVSQGQTDFATVQKPIRGLADALQKVAAGKQAFFSWQALLDTGGGMNAPTRRFIVVQPQLNYAGLMPGAQASETIRQATQALRLDPQHGVRVRLTGQVALADQQFESLTERVWLVTGTMLLSVLIMLWLATKSKRLVGSILSTTLIGLLLTAAVGLAVVGRFNLISVAFIPLFVGLGVDFGIQLSVRFQAERLECGEIKLALIRAATAIGVSLALAAAAITLGFFAFLPTDYVGVSELGIIAGLGMIMGLALNLTLLPALVVLLKPKREIQVAGTPAMAPVDHFLIHRRKVVLWAFGLSTLVSIALLPLVRFDFNPLHLQNPKGEAMATLLDIMRDPNNSPNTIDVLTPSLPAADQLAARLAKVPRVDRTVTLSSFVPDDQTPKLAAVADAQLLLDPTLNPIDIQPAPSDADNLAAVRKAAADLRSAATTGLAPGAADALRLAGALEAIAAGPPQIRARATETLVPPLNVMLDQIRTMLQAQPVTLQSLPPELVRDWVAPDGRARAQVSPKGDSNNNEVLTRFSEAVLAVAPNATGTPISVQQAGETITRAFLAAGVLSLVVISALLLLALRSLRETAFTLAPIVLAGFLTLATCVVINQPINFANIIAFPLLFGVGVAFHIYFVMAWRAGATNLLQSSLARGVFFSAMTTGMAFGSLIFSTHPGTASMGKILMISLLWTLVAALIFEPALLGPANPQAAKGDKR